MIWVRPIQTHCVEVFWMPVSPSRPSLGLRGGHEGPWTKIFIFVTVKNFQWMCVPIFFSVHYWPKSVPLVHFKQNQSRCFWEKFSFLYTQFWPKTALFWPRGADFDPKTQKYSETSCYNPKPCIPGQNLVSERLCHFWGLQAPQPPPRPPQTPPRVPGAQKWPKCTCTSPVLIINDKKTTFGWVNILTYFFTRNAPKMFSYLS